MSNFALRVGVNNSVLALNDLRIRITLISAALPDEIQSRCHTLHTAPLDFVACVMIAQHFFNNFDPDSVSVQVL